MIEIVLIYPVLYYQNCLHCRGRHAPIWGAWLWIKTIQNWFSSHFQQTSTICRLFDLSKLSTLACFDSGRMFSSSSSTRHAGQSFKERTKPWSAALHCSKDRRIKLIISNVIDTCQVYASLMTMNDLTCFSCISCGTHTYICICIYMLYVYIYISISVLDNNHINHNTLLIYEQTCSSVSSVRWSGALCPCASQCANCDAWRHEERPDALPLDWFEGKSAGNNGF